MTDISKNKIHAVLQHFKYKTLDELYRAIGLGQQIGFIIANCLITENLDVSHIDSPPSQEPYAIKGSQDMAVKFAECCRPIPGDAIAGILMQNKGLTVHQESCKKLDKWRHRVGLYLELNWAEQVIGDFKVDLTIEANNRQGIIAEITSKIARTKANIADIQMHHQDNYHGIIHLLLSVHDRTHLATIIRRMRSITGVIKVSRSKPVQN